MVHVVLQVMDSNREVRAHITSDIGRGLGKGVQPVLQTPANVQFCQVARQV